jgi:hypothetical protein
MAPDKPRFFFLVVCGVAGAGRGRGGRRCFTSARAIQQTPGITIADANARSDAVIAQFNDLAVSLTDKRQETEAENS